MLLQQICASTNQEAFFYRVCIDEIEDVVEEEEDESTQSARLSLNEEDPPSKPQVLFLQAIMFAHFICGQALLSNDKTQCSSVTFLLSIDSDL